MSIHGTKQPTEYTDGRTKQSFKDETDVNQIINQHARMGTLSHLEQWGGQYGDLADFDFQNAQNQIAHANTMFEQLPPNVKKHFHNSPERFFTYVNDPENADELREKLPELLDTRYQAIPSPRDVQDPVPAEPAEPDPTPGG